MAEKKHNYLRKNTNQGFSEKEEGVIHSPKGGWRKECGLSGTEAKGGALMVMLT